MSLHHFHFLQHSPNIHIPVLVGCMLTETAPQAFVFKQSFKWDQGNFPQNKISIYVSYKCMYEL